MKILVTGGCGFIGSHTVDKLIEDGHRVIVADNLSTGHRENLHPQALLHEVNVESQDFLLLMKEEKPALLYHFAAQIDVQKSVLDPVADATQNIIGTIKVLEAMAAAGTKKIIYASSAAAYGDPSYLPVDENHPTYPLSFYGISKFTPEHYIRVFCGLHEMQYTILRYANVYGIRQEPKGEGGVVSILIDKFNKGESPVIFGNGNQTRDFIYIKDIAAANAWVCCKGHNQVFNVSNNARTSILDLFTQMRTMAGSSAEPVFAPPRPGDILHSVLSNEKIYREAGWHPAYTLEQGLRETIEYYCRVM